MKFFRNNVAFRVLFLLIALHILNFSIDPPDPESDFKAEDLSYNDIESISELVVEDWMGIANAFPEHDEPDDDKDTFVLKSIELYCQWQQIKVAFVEHIEYYPIHNDYYAPAYITDFSREIIQPPEA